MAGFFLGKNLEDVTSLPILGRPVRLEFSVGRGFFVAEDLSAGPSACVGLGTMGKLKAITPTPILGALGTLTIGQGMAHNPADA